MKRTITDFHQDEQGDWVAELSCGHRQHVRHSPPWSSRPWVLTGKGRQEKIGAALECKECEADGKADNNRGPCGV